MPRSYMFTKEQVLDAAIELTREKGFSAVPALPARWFHWCSRTR